MHVQELQRSGRRNRRPTHTFNVKHKPFQLQPMLIAPVLPGETLRNLLLQDRCVTDPINNPLTGWHTEYYFFYVKLRDLPNWAEVEKMLLTDAYTLPGETVMREHFHGNATAVDWVGKCLEVVKTSYFRAQDEDRNEGYLGNLPLAKITNKNWWDSLGVNLISDPDWDRPEITVGVDDKITGEEIYQALATTLENYTYHNLSYEDWLRMYGVSIPDVREEKGYPELIRYIREWSYPSNTVNPTDGTPSSAVSWSIQERADKDRYFKEPGFIFGLCLVRPKVYSKVQNTAATSLMGFRGAWMPPEPSTNAAAFVRFSNATAGPLNTATACLADVKDLFMYGDQFQSYDAATETGVNAIDLPKVVDTSHLNKYYPSATDITSLFKTSGKEYIRHDGIVQLTIASKLMDMSSTTEYGTGA